VHISSALGGGTDAALRAPSAWCGVATVPAMAWLSSRWLGRETAGWTAWLAAFSPFLVWYSQEARSYSMLILAVCVSGALMLELARLASRRAAALYGASAATGLLAAPAFALVLPLHLRWWLADPAQRRRRLLIAGAGAAGLALMALPWVRTFVTTWDWSRLHPGHVAGAEEMPLRGPITFHAGGFPYVFYTFMVGYTFGPSPRELRADPTFSVLRHHVPEIAAVALLGAGIALVGLGALSRRRRLWDAALWIGVPALIVTWFAVSNFKVFHPRYFATALPMVLMVAAAALADLGARGRALLGAPLALLWAVSLAHYYAWPSYGKEDMRSAGRRVSELARADERVLSVNATDLMQYYYDGPARLEPFWLGVAADSTKLEREFDRTLTDVPAAWVVLSRPEDLDPAGRFARLMDRRTEAADRIVFEGVRVWHVRRSPVPREN